MNRFSEGQFNGVRKKSLEGIRRTLDKAEKIIPPERKEEDHPSFIEKLAREKAKEEAVIITDETAEPASENAELSGESERKDLKPKFGKRSLARWGIAAGLAAAVALGVLFSTVWARLTLTIKPRVENVALQEIGAAFDTSVSRTLAAQKVIPAELLVFSRKVKEEFESTGREFIQEKAEGKVKVYNRFSSSPQVLVENTRFVTEKGLLFRLPKTITIPGAKVEEGKIIPNFLETKLAAASPGEDFNANGEVTLKIPGFKGTPKYEGFYAVASEGFSGGFSGEARVVSPDDITRSQEEVTKKVFDELKEEIIRKVPANFKLAEILREIQITSLNSPRPKARLERFSVEAEARGRALVFREADVAALLRELVLQDNKTKEVVEGSANLTYQTRNVNFEKGRAEVVIIGNLKTKAVIPQPEIASLVRGKKEGSIIEILKSRSDVASFRIAFFPPWRFRAPQDTSKIRIVVQEP